VLSRKNKLYVQDKLRVLYFSTAPSTSVIKLEDWCISRMEYVEAHWMAKPNSSREKRGRSNHATL